MLFRSSQGTLNRETYGRDHHPRNFCMWMAGGGVKGGSILGETDDFSYNIVDKPVDVNSFNATILHLMGIDHTRLTYPHDGREDSLTDVTVTGARAIDAHTVEATVANGSARDGVQVVQVYAHRVDREGLPSDEPVNILAGYERVEVAAGTSATVRISLNADTYRTWDLVNGRWTTWSGDVDLRVGTSSRHFTHALAVSL